MSEEEWRWFQLSQSATKLSASEMASLEKQLLVEPANLDIRVQVFAYYSERQGNVLKHKKRRPKVVRANSLVDRELSLCQRFHGLLYFKAREQF